MAGKDACLQIYSVPKQNVICEPPAEVMEQIGGIQTALDAQTESLSILSSRMDSLDPDQLIELPEDVLAKLNSLDDIETIQTSHSSIMSGFEIQVDALLARMTSLEIFNREEFSRLVQMQTDLIAAMWQQSNATLHEEYLDKLNYSVNHFLVQLQSLELVIRDSLESKEKLILQQLADTTRASRLELNITQMLYTEQLTQLGMRLADEQEMRRQHMNVTESQGEVMENIRLTSENLVLRQVIMRHYVYVSTLRSDMAVILIISADYFLMFDTRRYNERYTALPTIGNGIAKYILYVAFFFIDYCSAVIRTT
jgi:hypothetical protein